MRNLAATISKVLVGPEYLRGKGYGSAMVYEVARIAFEEEHLHRLELIVFDFNHAAIKCYKNIGFSIEGHLRDYRKVKGEFWSSYIMSLLEGEWITRRRNSSSLSLEPSE
jgi:RimJ/RimL family protein N-acetyltransferase